ncbi:MAG: ribbon-helix-helix protein, CopG family [Thermoplasmatales archaeon]
MQVQLATKISPETYQALDRYAKTSGRSKSSIIEEALRRYLEEESRKPPADHGSV